jgi:outer membrane protein TolC
VFDAALQVRLPIFGQRAAHVRAAESAVAQTTSEVALARWKLRHDARLAYYTVARADDDIAIAAELEALARRIADMAREKFEVGTGTRLDERQAALVHVRALQDVSDRRAVARVARLELARQLGAHADDLGEIGDALVRVGVTPALGDLLAGSRALHPELRALDAERDAALARAHAARADRRPMPTLDVGLELLDPSTCNATSRCIGPRAALSFELPVLNLNGGPIARAEAEARLAELKAAAATVRIESAIRAAYENFTAATARARFFDSAYVPAALEVEAMAREGFAVGRSGLLPLIEASRAVLDARLGRAEALYAVQAARADLEEASGVPLSAP